MPTKPKFHRSDLAACIAMFFGIAAFTPVCFAGTDIVTNCNDTGAGSLRDTIMHAATGDIVDLNTVNMHCSSITLTSGEIVVPQDDLEIKYDGNQQTQVTISANLSSRIFDHQGAGTLKLQRLNLQFGKYDNTNAASPTYANGGCVYSAGDVYLLSSTLDQCEAKDTRGFRAYGGGVYVRKNLTLKNSVISNNSAYSSAAGVGAGGGGAFADSANVYYSSISGNTTRFKGASGNEFGGGLVIDDFYGDASVIANSTLSGNSARGAGALDTVAGNSTASLAVRNSTISGNSTTFTIVDLNVQSTLSNSTIASNTLGPGNDYVTATVALDCAPTCPTRFDSSIIAGNSGRHEVYAAVQMTIAGANNLIENSVDAIVPPDTIFATDPMLLPLADNGGPTQTQALRYRSPAFGHGNDTANLATDQRGSGYVRATAGGSVDIGAYQEQVRDRIFANSFE